MEWKKVFPKYSGKQTIWIHLGDPRSFVFVWIEDSYLVM